MLRYHLIAFLSGAVVLVLEIIGARILAPYLGTAYFVWVNIIGVILGALSLGYWLGGILADRNQRMLPFIFLAGASSVGLIIPLHALLPHFGSLGTRAGSLIASLMLFAPSGIILGTVSPYIIKLASHDLARLGKTSGGIFASSTMGSIAGTFVTGFLLLPVFTLPQILYGLIFTLCALAIISGGWRNKTALIVVAALTAGTILAGSVPPHASKQIVFEKNSQYYNIRVHEERRTDGKTVRTLLLDGSTQSARFVAEEGMPYRYIELSAQLIDALKPLPRSALAIGGGGYSIPAHIKKRSWASEVTVVEIDPEVTRTAERFFLDGHNLGITTLNEDGRVFLNRNTEQYDITYTDAYSGAFAVPAHMATREAFYKIRDSLAAEGVAIFNIASALEGKNSALFRSLWKTFGSVFAQKVVFATNPLNPEQPQNIIVAAKNGVEPFAQETLAAFAESRYTKTPDISDVPLLTDTFAPTDSLVQSLVQDIYPALRQYQF